MSLKSGILFTVLVLGIGGGIWFFVARHNDQSAAAEKAESAHAEGRVVPVLATAVAQRDVPVYLEGLGNVIAYKTVTVKTQVDGRLDKIAFREGQKVRHGDLLAQIDPRPFEIQLHQAQGALDRDRATLEDDQLNLTRYDQLRDQKLVAQQQVDDQRAVVGQFAGAVRVDEAAVESAKLNLDYARIVSPIDGVTGVRLVDQGNVIHAADATGIVVITQLDPIAVLFTLPEDDLPKVAAEIQDHALDVEAYSRDGSTKLGSGKLMLIDNQILQATATMRLKAVFANPTHSLWPNLFVKTRLMLSVRKNALVVPATVVQRGPKGIFAYVIGPGQKVSARPIEAELTIGDVAIIARGLKAGEQVVVDGQNQLRPGSRVQPRPVTQAAQAGGEARP